MAGKSFRIDARALLTLGRDSIKDHTTAVVELVKNSYDADADIVEIDLLTQAPDGGLVRIADNGIGMSELDVENQWLRIGYSEKRLNRITGRLNRRKTGEKGIGRLSADRLGSALELRTKAASSDSFGMNIDWTLFEVTGKDLGEIEMEVLDHPQPTIPAAEGKRPGNTGTELLIQNLRQQWTPADIEKLHSELSLLLPPYPEMSQKFELRFQNDVLPELDGQVESAFAAKGEIEFEGRLLSSGKLKFTLSHRDQRRQTKKTPERTLNWEEIAPAVYRGEEIKKPILGPVQIRLSFFPRKSDLLEGTQLSMGQLRTFLDQNAGVRIYRDLIRVKPYGDPTNPEGDWLGLSERRSRNPAGAGREDFRVAATQLVGAIFIGRDKNPTLVDSSSREGLVESDALRQLRSVVMSCIAQIENLHHRNHIADQPAGLSRAVIAKAAVNSLQVELSSLRSELSQFQDALFDNEERETEPPFERLENVLAKLKGAEKAIDEIASQNTVYRGLATVGIASAVFGHETEISTDLAQGSLTLAQTRLKKKGPDIDAVIEDLNGAEKYLQQIASWGRFALLRVKKDKRQKAKASITQLLNDVLKELENPLRESSIKLERSLADVTARTFPMDIEAILVNLVTNAYYAVKKVSKNRVIDVTLKHRVVSKRPGFEICVTDSGQGIQPDHLQSIWEPLFSTRVDEKGKAIGTGLGLTIVKSAVEELGGTVSAAAKSSLGGARFTVWVPGD